MGVGDKRVQYLVADTTAFIQNAPLQEITDTVITCKEVVDEITSKRQLRRLVVLPYDLEIRQVFPENIKIITEFAMKTGDYPSLSATDIKVMALTYQLEKEKMGTDHIRTEPATKPSVNIITKPALPETNADVTGFFLPGHSKQAAHATDKSTNEESDSEPDATVSDLDDVLAQRFNKLQCEVEDENGDQQCDGILPFVNDNTPDDDDEEEDEDSDGGWITPSNIKEAKKQVKSELMDEKQVTVACMTTDFAMQNVLKQMNLNVAALDGRMIKQLRTFLLRCYACFKITSIMTKQFCPKCGNNTLKKVAVSLDEKGQMKIHINARRPLTARGKKFSLPKIKGGKHPNNPVLVADQPMADNKPSRMAKTKLSPLDDDYIAGFSPFATRDVNSRSATLGIRPGNEYKYWMKQNPNESSRRRK